jgi:DNA-binding SARP family transcriptional activator
METFDTEIAPPGTIVTRLLAPFQMQVNGHPIVHWPSGKAKSIFKYLLVKRGRAVSRERMIALFWSDAEPEAARNCLNVAAHRIRRELAKADPQFPFVLLRDGCYVLNPRLRVWTDADAFTKHFEQARALEYRGWHAEALRDYASCESLYEGELLAEDPPSPWLMTVRQTFRDRYLAVLDRLSRHCFDTGEYGACTTLCNKMIGVDACNELAHRMLMRCHAKLDQPQLAGGQYRSCVQVLAPEVRIPAMPAILT